MEIRRDLEHFPVLKKLVPYLTPHKGYIAGGAFKQILLGEKERDLDIFFRSKEDMEEAVDYYVKSDYSLVYENDNCISFLDEANDVRIELVRTFFGTPEEVISSFDFTIAQFAFATSYNGLGDLEFRIYHHEDFFEHLLLKRLVIGQNLPHPINTFERVLKYEGYGFNLCPTSKFRLLEAVQNYGPISQGDFIKSLYHGVD